MVPFLIGIAGGSGSGKTTFTRILKEQFGDRIAVMYLDSYYRARDDLTTEERSLINYDHPDALETDMLIGHLKRLREGLTVETPVYDFSVHNRTEETITIEPRPVILVEGMLLFQNDELRDMFDIKIYIEADADVRILRRVKRDITKRGRTLESVMQQYLTTVKPMHELFVEPTKKLADIIVTGGRNAAALDLVQTKIQMILDRQK